MTSLPLCVHQSIEPSQMWLQIDIQQRSADKGKFEQPVSLAATVLLWRKKKRKKATSTMSTEWRLPVPGGIPARRWLADKRSNCTCLCWPCWCGGSNAVVVVGWGRWFWSSFCNDPRPHSTCINKERIYTPVIGMLIHMLLFLLEYDSFLSLAESTFVQCDTAVFAWPKWWMRVSVECFHLVRVPASKGISGGKSVKKTPTLRCT